MEPTTPQSTTAPAPRLAPALRSALTSAWVQLSVVLVLASMVLDGGEVFLSCFVGLAALWCGIAFVLVRRRHAPTRLDLILVRAGTLPACAAGFVLRRAIWG